MKYTEFLQELWKPVLPTLRQIGAGAECLASGCEDAEGRQVSMPRVTQALVFLSMREVLFGSVPVKGEPREPGVYLYDEAANPRDQLLWFDGTIFHSFAKEQFVFAELCPTALYGPLRFVLNNSSMDPFAIERVWQAKLAADAKKPANVTQNATV